MLMPLLRRFAYPPDGEPPAIIVDGTPWSERRDASILPGLLKLRSADQIALALEGVRLLADAPGLYGDALSWIAPHEKFTLRCLSTAHSRAAVPLFNRAVAAACKAGDVRDRRARQASSAPAPIGGLARAALRRAGGERAPGAA